MPLKLRLSYCVLVLLPLLAISAHSATDSAAPVKIRLERGWAIQSSCKVPEKGDLISTAAYAPKGWISATVPATVLAAQVAAKVGPEFAEPYYGTNFLKLPGANYPHEKVFAQLPMPQDSPYRCSWWYRTTFRLPATYKGKMAWLNFGGINYRANVWLNGRQIANSTEVAGAYRTYEFDVSTTVKQAGDNVLAVEVIAPTEKDLGINWVDWNPTPPDKDMGLWRGVWLTQSGPVAIRNPQVTSKVDTKTLAHAELTVRAEVRNATDKAIKGTLRGRIESVAFNQAVELAPNETKIVTFAPEQFAQLRFENPRLWWPWQMRDTGPSTAPQRTGGSGRDDDKEGPAASGPGRKAKGAEGANLHSLVLEFDLGGQVSDTQGVRFGIREVTAEMTDKGAKMFRVNGKPILIRGGGWSPDMMLREDDARLEKEFAYVRDMGLNTIRLEGKMETDSFYDMADSQGILVMAGWCCCDIWEQWKDWPEENKKVAVESLRSQLLRMRNHPSVFVWLNGSDNPPVPDVEQAYLQVEKEVNWPNPVISSATQQSTTVTGPSGVKMTGPYDWVPPEYWLIEDNTKAMEEGKHRMGGGAYGFNTETSPGPAIPPTSVLERFIPKDKLWPVNDVWNFHAGLEGFPNINVFQNAMNARYGEPSDLRAFQARAEAMAYEGERAMFEAYARNKYTSTGLIQWMLNNAWPSIIWHLYDYYLMPAGGYFGTKKANEPVHVLYGYDDRGVWVVNSTYKPVKALRVSATVLNFDLSPKFTKTATVDVAEDGSSRVFDIPQADGLSTTYFVKLEVKDSSGAPLSDNFYWLSTKPEQYAWDKSDYRLTPVTQHGDFTALAGLPDAKVMITAQDRIQNGQGTTRVVIKNTSKALAFQTRLRLLKGKGGQDVIPAMWEDNYITLMPGEERAVAVKYASADLGGAKPWIEADGWNVAVTAASVDGTSR